VADETITSIRLCYLTTSAAAAASAGLASIFKTSVNVNDVALLCDVMALSDFAQPLGTVGNVLSVQRHAIGLRVALMVLNAKANLSLDFPSVAASAAIDGTKVQYEVQTYGLVAGTVADVISAMPGTGPLTPDMFVALQNVLTVELPAYLKTLGATVNSSQLSNYTEGSVSLNMDRFARARLINKAMLAIAGGNTLRQALAVAGADPDVTRLVYAEMANLTDANLDTAPATENQQAANLWLGGN
jgi:hypothetical protein